jgi:hypothetical protein
MATPKQKLEGNRVWPFTIARRDRLVKRIMEETGIGEYEATIAYRIATSGLLGKAIVTEVRDNG